ncbi:MAG: hypothetical protein NTZ14_01870 [Hyphomicrobiales bacterium]|nr:hypothetical protein [Hyphomicrobiales bacterium]
MTFFVAAKKQAEAFAELVETGGIVSAKIETVADACREYEKTAPKPKTVSRAMSMNIPSQR